ncbi:unnamed protein product [Didymodactylos carnosus]|uniref:G domain-containing protein n=1 Tax=Didymodactylos carnosus TaxID=1234261 RepID=A0A814D881_9BILA|nr:unnamed protein product [Didymodactylos carnosus]CAF1325916.1 unnamed protein product [Didymodactylos carnosus]CAF3729926.1 unnamed protein product [Didymodactylos carnosus]CAF4137020.1 unnamed protein product [Didymodactylos carnosus]
MMNTSSNGTPTEFNILLCGSPRVGNGSLINALCQTEVAKTSESLDTCTKGVQCYTLNGHYDSPPIEFQVNLWDTPGIESWRTGYIKKTFCNFVTQTNPICLIYCASPGSFAKLEEIAALLAYCKAQKIFCALVLTHMYFNNKRDATMKIFKDLLSPFGVMKEEYYGPHKHRVMFFGDFGLCTMVNSKQYLDECLGVSEPPEGINELIYAIAISLKEEQLLGWFYTISKNRAFWMTIGPKLTQFIQDSFDRMTAKVGDTYDIINKLLQSLGFVLSSGENAITHSMNDVATNSLTKTDSVQPNMNANEAAT